LRIFADQAGRTNRSLKDVKGEALVVSQFTLYADISRGRRPSFIRAGDPKEAEALYEHFAEELESNHGIATKTGSFGAHMTVSLDNDGPVTLALSSDDWPTRA
jgi:D-tyrosyl-tRNA(Tyr) deacylase